MQGRVRIAMEKIVEVKGREKKVVMGIVSDEEELIFVLMFVCECFSSAERRDIIRVGFVRAASNYTLISC